MQVGITYLAGENPGLLAPGAQLDLWVLPLKKASLEDNVFLQRRFWPRFPANNETVATVEAVRWETVERATLSVV